MMYQNLKNVVLSAISGSVAAVLILAIYFFLFGTNKEMKIGVVDMKKILSSHMENLEISEMTDQELKENSEKYGLYLNFVINDLSENMNISLFTTGVLVSEENDYTEYVEMSVYNLMMRKNDNEE